MANCRSCGAPIEWAVTTNGKNVPLDEQPSPKGNLVIVVGKVRGYTDEDARLQRDRRTSHFVTCPDAADWRKK